MQTNLNTYTNVMSPAFTSSIYNTDWLSKIKAPDKELKIKIETARKIKDLYLLTGDKDFDEKYKNIKKTLPAVTWNATFSNNYKKDENFESSTGLLYIDIDHKDFKIEMLDTNMIYSYYISIGGLGYSVIVKVEKNINPNNFKSTYLSICDILNISQYIDTNAIKLTQYSILSYDTNLFVNPDSFVFPTVINDLSNNFHFEPNTLIIKKGEHIKGTGPKTDLQQIVEQNYIRYNNLNDFDFDGKEYITNHTERFDFVECWTPFKIITDGRKRIMMNYIRNLIWLNPNIDMKLLINTSMFINKKICEVPLQYKKIKEFIDVLIKQKNAGTLTPKIRNKCILFNPKMHLSDTKLKLWGKAKSIRYKEIGLIRLYEIIEDWHFEFNGKLTTRSVAANSDMNIKTVKKYWCELQDYIKEQNEANKDEIKLFKQRNSRVDKSPTDKELIQLMVDMDVLTLNEDVLIEQPHIDDEDIEFTNLYT